MQAEILESAAERLPPQGEGQPRPLAQQDAAGHVHGAELPGAEGVADAPLHQELRQEARPHGANLPRADIDPVGAHVRGDPGILPVEVEEVHLPGHPALPPHMPVALGEVDPPALLQPPPPRVPQGEDPGLPGLREEVEPPARAAVDGEIPRGEPQVLVLQSPAIVAEKMLPK